MAQLKILSCASLELDESAARIRPVMSDARTTLSFVSCETSRAWLSRPSSYLFSIPSSRDRLQRRMCERRLFWRSRLRTSLIP